jgi:hypothetical protein
MHSEEQELHKEFPGNPQKHSPIMYSNFTGFLKSNILLKRNMMSV